MRRFAAILAGLLILPCAIVATAGDGSVPSVSADAPTPTPTFLPDAVFTVPNNSGAPADAFDFRFPRIVSPASGFTLLGSPGACGIATVSSETFVIGYEVVQFGFIFISVGSYVTIGHVHWPMPCVAPNDAVSVGFADLGFHSPAIGASWVFFNSAIATVTPTFTPTATPTITPTPLPATSTPLPSAPFLALDCDTTTPGVQDDCSVPLGTTALDVDVVFRPRADVQLGGFNFAVVDPDKTRLDPPEIVDPSTQNGNPDFNESIVVGPGFLCAPDINDDGSSGPTAAASLISCSIAATGASIPTSAGSDTVLGRVHYDIPASAATGAVVLSPVFAAFYDTTPGSPDLASCQPLIFNPLDCRTATIHLVAPPTTTPTFTPTFTPTVTPTLTPTRTATPVIPSVAKQPEGNAANADLSVPKANLWLCVAPAACAGMGEGNLRVVEQATSVFSDYDSDGVSDAIDPDISGTGLSNTDLGLGAYEFSVEYDNFVIQSVNPCDIVFGPGGAGATRGPVDELNSSAPNPDCSPDPNSSADGMCSMSLVLENVLRFGCVTNGSTPYGPSGSFALASLNLIPHPDLTNDIFPGNNNGVITVLKDNGCELADIFGHPVAGSVNGGLTPTCSDLAVTVRILEGDLNLDCKVDVTDEQLISFRYGAFFGDLSYTKWHDLEPATHDLDIDIKDLQKVFGRDGSTCQAPIPAQPPADPPAPFG